MPAAKVAESRFTPREINIIVIGVMVGMFLTHLDITILGPALPQISADFQNAESVSWVVTTYLLVSTAVTPIYGKLSDLYGRKIMLQIAFTLFLVASVLCALATSMPQLIVFRAFQGLGGGGLMVMANSVIADVVSPRERGRYQGYTAGTLLAGTMIGPVLGGLFVDHLTWRWVFWINIPFCLFGLLVAQRTLKRLRAKGISHKIDHLGAILIVGTITCILLAISMGGVEAEWDSPLIIGLIAAGSVLLMLSILQELRATEPILPPHLFRNHAFVICNFVNTLRSMTYTGAVVFLPVFLQMLYGLSGTDSGLMMLPMVVLAPAVMILCSRMIVLTGRYKIYPIFGLATSSVGMFMLSWVTSSTPMWLTGGAMMLIGVGSGLIGPIPLLSIQNSVGWRDIGIGTASNNFFRSLGNLFGVALFGSLLIAQLNMLVGSLPGYAELGLGSGADLLHAGRNAIAGMPASLRTGVADTIAQAFHHVFLAGAIITGLAFAVFLFLKEVPLRTTSGITEKESAEARGSD